jgi:aspartyl protease family protein
MLRALVLAVLAACAGLAQATSVMVMSLGQDRADLVVNGTAVRQVRSGQVTPEGVRLVSATRNEAVLEIEGKQHTLGIGQSNTAAAVLKADPLGHFRATVYINGAATTALIDTGASYVSMSSEEARRLSIDYRRNPKVQIQTANGRIDAYRVNLVTVRVGEITLHNVDGVVAEATNEQTGIPVLGMSFLNWVDMRRAGDTLTLTRRR